MLVNTFHFLFFYNKDIHFFHDFGGGYYDMHIEKVRVLFSLSRFFPSHLCRLSYTMAIVVVNLWFILFCLVLKVPLWKPIALLFRRKNVNQSIYDIFGQAFAFIIFCFWKCCFCFFLFKFVGFERKSLSMEQWDERNERNFYFCFFFCHRLNILFYLFFTLFFFSSNFLSIFFSSYLL